MKEIKYPSVKTFFIANSGDEYSFGSVEINQCMATGLDNLLCFSDVSKYQNKLEELGLLSNAVE